MTIKFYPPSFSSFLSKNTLAFYPDTLNLQLDCEQYQSKWQELQNPNGYLYALNGSLSQVGIVRYYFEHFKGWLGFNNDCQPQKIQMAAKKLAYFGYLNGFNQQDTYNDLNLWDEQNRPDLNFMTNCKNKRCNDISGELQQHLIHFYKTHADSLSAFNEPYGKLPLPHHTGFKFGDTYIASGDFNYAAQLDILDDAQLGRIIPNLKDGHSTLENSQARSKYIAHAMKKIDENLKNESLVQNLFQKFASLFVPSWRRPSIEQLLQSAEQTLALEPKNVSLYAPLFVKLKLAVIQTLEPAKKSAMYQETFMLLQTHLPKDHAFLFLNEHFLHDEGFKFIDAQSALTQSWAKHLLDDKLPKALLPLKNKLAYRIAQIRVDIIPQEQLQVCIDGCIHHNDHQLAFQLIKRLFQHDKQAALVQLSIDPAKFEPLIKNDAPIRAAYARRMIKNSQDSYWGFFSTASKIEAAAKLDATIETTEGAAHFLTKYVDSQEWEKAWALLKKRTDSGLCITELPAKPRGLLASHYIKTANQYFAFGIAEKNPEKALKFYQQGFDTIKIAESIIDTDETRHAHNLLRRQYAEIILKHGEERGPLSLNQIDAALNIIQTIEKNPCSLVDTRLNDVLLKTLYLKVQLLHKSCLQAEHDVDKSYASDKLKTRCQPLLVELMPCLDKLIKLQESLLNAENHDDIAKKLAHLYFLKGDCLDYFQLTGDAVHCFKKASELEPNQPFYHIRQSEVREPGTKTDEISDIGVDLLQKCGLSGIEYLHWGDERWMPEDQRIWKVAIPEPHTPEASWGSTFGF